MPKHQISIEVEPQYLPDQSDPANSLHSFSYTVTITNTGTASAQLISRHWLIHDARGHTEEVKGLGVVGRQPLLRPGESFQYTSGCQLRSASGSMRGSYFFVTEDADRFDAPIPLFVLEAHAGPGAPQRILH